VKSITLTFISLLLLFTASPCLSADVHRMLIEIRYIDSPLEIPLNQINVFGYGIPPYFLGSSIRENNRCILHVYKPKNAADTFRMEILGHELMHCTHGQYHR